MKLFIRTAIIVSTLSALSGCSTIVFTNDNEPAMDEYGQWHHNLAYSLYEYSPPVQPSEFCQSDWAEIKVEKDIVTAIAGAAIIGPINIWDPWAVTVKCAR